MDEAVAGDPVRHRILPMLLLHKNLIKKIMGLNIMDTAVYLFLAAKGLYHGAQGAHRSGRNPGGGGLYQSGAQRAGAHGNRGFRIRYGADALPHHPAVRAGTIRWIWMKILGTG